MGRQVEEEVAAASSWRPLGLGVYGRQPQAQRARGAGRPVPAVQTDAQPGWERSRALRGPRKLSLSPWTSAGQLK